MEIGRKLCTEKMVLKEATLQQDVYSPGHMKRIVSESWPSRCG